jgi:RNA polymerase sigma-70 factor, ECF subfamily
MSMTEPSDGELVARAHGGSREAAAALFERHWGTAWRLARTVSGRRDMADDIAQDAFERAFAALGRFDRSRPFGPWLHRIVVNRTLDLLRSERRLVGLEAPERLESEWCDVGAEDRGLLEAVAWLTPQRRVVIVLRYGLGYTPADIARMLEVPVGTVHSRLARALDDLRQRERERDADRA